MEDISKIILKNKVIVILIFLMMTISSIFLNKYVNINYNLSEYLPSDSKSLIAIEKMTKEYSDAIYNVRLLIPEVTIEEALSYKKNIEVVAGVNSVIWADNYTQIESGSTEILYLEEWYKDKNALYLISIDTEDSLKVLKDIKEIVKDESNFAGDAVNTASAQDKMQDEVNAIMLFVIPIILIILILTTSSWFEPVLFLVTIGISIIINMGTNVIFGSISSVTQSTTAILQLAVSMDYAIFLLHRFAIIRRKGIDVKSAMAKAMKDSTSTIIASGLTTILGFLALVVMKFEIGADLGIVLAKGIVFSLLSVLVLLPVLAIYTYKLIDKTKHNSFIPSFKKVSQGIFKIRYIMMALILISVIPSFIASQNNTFLYGSTGVNSEDSKVYKDTQKINSIFGVDNQMVLLIPRGDFSKESKINEELSNLEGVQTVTSFVSTIGIETPIEYLPKEVVSQFISKSYSRIIVKTNVDEEGDEAFALVDNIKEIGNKYYGDNYHLAGISVTNYDMKQIVTKDNIAVNVVAVVSIVIILMITFKSLSIPIILILAIETAIWMNLSLSYIAGHKLNYIGYLVVSAVQLGATVDYAILFAKKYLERRRENKLKDAITKTVESTAPSILSSAFILGISGLSIGIISTNGVISELGTLVGRGALISALLVLIFIPAMFTILDKIIEKTTLKGFDK
jgi:hypothetical protein